MARSSGESRWVVLHAVDSFEYVGERPTLDNAAGFVAGAQEGGSYFGDGVSAWVLPEDSADLAAFLDDVPGAREDWPRVRAKLPAWAVDQISVRGGGSCSE